VNFRVSSILDSEIHTKIAGHKSILIVSGLNFSLNREFEGGCSEFRDAIHFGFSEVKPPIFLRKSRYNDRSPLKILVPRGSEIVIESLGHSS
jgi:hypothetical protein